MLRLGKKYLLPDEGPCIVVKVDECRAQVKLLSKEEQVVTAYKDTPQQMEIRFLRGTRLVNISANSELKMID